MCSGATGIIPLGSSVYGGKAGQEPGGLVECGGPWGKWGDLGRCPVEDVCLGIGAREGSPSLLAILPRSQQVLSDSLPDLSSNHSRSWETAQSPSPWCAQCKTESGWRVWRLARIILWALGKPQVCDTLPMWRGRPVLSLLLPSNENFSNLFSPCCSPGPNGCWHMLAAQWTVVGRMDPSLPPCVWPSTWEPSPIVPPTPEPLSLCDYVPSLI